MTNPGKKLTDLDAGERLALVALMEQIVLADGTVSAAEGVHVRKVVEMLGSEEYRRLTDEADERFKDDAALKDHLRTVTDPEARELILGTVLEEAAMQGVGNEEDDLIHWLSSEWQVPIVSEAPPEA